jgi:hypothetical protein
VHHGGHAGHAPDQAGASHNEGGGVVVSSGLGGDGAGGYGATTFHASAVPFEAPVRTPTRTSAATPHQKLQ